MALGFYFRPAGFTPEIYTDTLSQLDAAGAGSPDGRTLHVALDVGGAIHVFDIWESQEQFDAFGSTLVPIMTAAGVDPAESRRLPAAGARSATAAQMNGAVGRTLRRPRARAMKIAGAAARSSSARTKRTCRSAGDVATLPR
jgi:hypothetical protein